jgi:hypothetical protein
MIKSGGLMKKIRKAFGHQNHVVSIIQSDNCLSFFNILFMFQAILPSHLSPLAATNIHLSEVSNWGKGSFWFWLPEYSFRNGTFYFA